MPTYATLSDILQSDGALQRITEDCRALVDQEVAAKSGVSATVLKASYKVVTTFAPGYYETMISRIVPKLMEKLQPYWTQFNEAGGGNFGEFLAARGSEVAEAMLSVTDAMAERSNRGVIKKAYGAVRGSAAEHIQAALPSVGALVEKYAA
ncbi:MAG: hypothetical protein IRY85_03445 [Micromonosporaceae bacterium]|nr:hypothetical protein [Micromonosporaceae bacterium]